MPYVSGANKILLNEVLLGKVFKCRQMMNGSSKKEGYHSHMSPDGKEIVIFDSAQINPRYIVHYENKSTNSRSRINFGFGEEYNEEYDEY